MSIQRDNWRRTKIRSSVGRTMLKGNWREPFLYSNTLHYSRRKGKFVSLSVLPLKLNKDTPITGSWLMSLGLDVACRRA